MIETMMRVQLLRRAACALAGLGIFRARIEEAAAVELQAFLACSR
jgi:hypothetical protein